MLDLGNDSGGQRSFGFSILRIGLETDSYVIVGTSEIKGTFVSGLGVLKHKLAITFP